MSNATPTPTPPANGKPWSWVQTGTVAGSGFVAALLAMFGVNSRIDNHEVRLAEFERDRREWSEKTDKNQEEILSRQRAFVERALSLDTLLREVLRLLKERKE